MAYIGRWRRGLNDLGSLAPSLRSRHCKSQKDIVSGTECALGVYFRVYFADHSPTGVTTNSSLGSYDPGTLVSISAENITQYSLSTVQYTMFVTL